MTEAFRTVLNMSITGGIAALAVVLLRIPLKRSPRWISCALWMVVFLRLLLPFSFSSPVSLLNGIGAPEPENGVVMYLPSDFSGETIVQNLATSSIPSSLILPTDSTSTSLAPTSQASADPMQIWLAIGTAIWLAGAAVILIQAIYLYGKLHNRVRKAVFVEPGVYETDSVDSPFVLGIFRPRIILPLTLLRQERELVLRHEQAHISRCDYLMKPLAFLILAVHWFNPLVWIAFRLFCDDMEASCDERAIRSLDREQIAKYGETLLRLGTRKAAFAAGPLAFGEHCTKERIVNVLNHKKPMCWVVVVAILAAIAAAIVLLANPLVRPRQAVEPTIKELDLADMKASDYDQVAYEIPKTGAIGTGANPSYFVSYSLDLSLLGDKSVTAERMAEFSNQLANGQAYIKAYLKINAIGCYDDIVANGKVEYVILKDDYYSYQIKPYPHRIRVGKMYWHCSEQFVLMILHPESLHWQHYGYAMYLGSVLNPYDMYLAKLEKLGVTMPLGKYVQYYYEQGGTEHKLTNDDYRLLVDSVAYYCIKNGMNWGTAYESYPITKVYGFTEPAEQGDDMSVVMASSFCAYLADKYGFDKLTSYCSGQIDFRQAFGTSFDKAFARWEKELVKKFS
jgi:beta-lactamase regulating signal transducer with metallopeptidase domain